MIHQDTHRSLDEDRDWYFFHEECPVPAELLTHIRPFTAEAARALWCEFVDSDPAHYHPMLIPDTAWPVQLWSSPVSARFHEDWEDNKATNFEAWLLRTIPWPDDASGIFTWSCTHSVETTWKVFHRCRRNFCSMMKGRYYGVYSSRMRSSFRRMEKLLRGVDFSRRPRISELLMREIHELQKRKDQKIRRE
jgi:hypothetical protein